MASDPVTWKPHCWSIPASDAIPVPQMPIKWMRPFGLIKGNISYLDLRRENRKPAHVASMALIL